MTVLGTIHTGLATLAIVLGIVIYTKRKGTQFHRLLGYGFLACMLGALGTAFVMPAVTFSFFAWFGPFHMLAGISLVLLIAGFVPAYQERPLGGWLRSHYTWMGWAYVGLVAAAIAEAAVRIPIVRGFGLAFWIAAFAASFVVCFVGLYFVYYYRDRTIKRVQTDYRSP